MFTTVTEYAYDANNRLTSVTTGTDTLSYTYDNNGNLLGESNGKTYSYNVLNQLVSFTNGPVTANYGYLPNGLRSYKSVSDGTNSSYSSFIWDGDDLVFEYKATNDFSPSLYVGTVYNYGHDLISQSNAEDNNYILFVKNTHGDVTEMLNAVSDDLDVVGEICEMRIYNRLK